MTLSPTSSSARARWTRLRGVLVEAAGRMVGVAARGLPGAAGPVLVCYGLWQAWPPLGWIAGGAFLLWLDRRMP